MRLNSPYGADGGADGLVGMEPHFAIFLPPDEADGKAATQLAAGGLVANPAVEAGPQDMQLGFADGALRDGDILPKNSPLTFWSNTLCIHVRANASLSYAGCSMVAALTSLLSRLAAHTRYCQLG